MFALMVQNGLHADPLTSGLAVLPMAVMFFLGSVVSHASSTVSAAVPSPPAGLCRR